MPGIGINPIVVSKGGGGGTCTSRAWVRNPDWLDFPSTSDGQEVIYILTAVYENSPNFLSFYGTVSSGTFEVDLYNDGTTITNHSTGQVDFNLDYTKGTGEIAKEGYKQVITKVTASNFSGAFDFYRQHGDAAGAYTSGILDVKMTSQNITSFVNGFRGSANRQYFRMLESFEWVGTCNVTNISYAFYQTPSLGKVKGNFSSLTNIGNTFNLGGLKCPLDLSEMTLPTSGVSSALQAFNGANIDFDSSGYSALIQGVEYPDRMFNGGDIQIFGTAANPIRLDSLNNAFGIYRMFYNCTELRQAYFDEVNSAAPQSLQQTFQGCSNLREITGLDGSSVTNTSAAFATNRSLSWLRISGLTVSFDISDCNFSREGLVQVFNDLADLNPAGSATITITNNPGVADLTGSDEAIATGKRWTIVKT